MESVKKESEALADELALFHSNALKCLIIIFCQTNGFHRLDIAFGVQLDVLYLMLNKREDTQNIV